MKSTANLKKMKENKETIAMVTAYDYPSAKLVEECGADMILVGDSLGMVVLGYESTVSVTMEDILLHTKAVKRGARDTFIVSDMPFMSFHVSEPETLKNAQRLIQEGGAHAVKLEGAGHVAKMTERLTEAGVPVVAHLGLTPQAVGVLGGYKVQGKNAETARQLIEDAKMAEAAGAFALVLECVPRQLAARVTEEISIPTIGIGAGNGTDGQVLVYHDLIGYNNGYVPKFVKQYADVSESIRGALNQYVEEVRSRHFPEEKHTFTMKQEEIDALYGGKE
ncbi:MAG TPA: 3-methyl-2-oxobutanoate hydroxymethyltransferase [Bacillales bacterium]|nr:3-methyl-2-oxobutanoate hydroxymethyltransferase [Bacillales bacterium]